jgi:hypothetical protein
LAGAIIGGAIIGAIASNAYGYYGGPYYGYGGSAYGGYYPTYGYPIFYDPYEASWQAIEEPGAYRFYRPAMVELISGILRTYCLNGTGPVRSRLAQETEESPAGKEPTILCSSLTFAEK